MLRLHLLAATQQPQLHLKDVNKLFQLLRAMPAAVNAALPTVQQQQQLLPSSLNWLPCSSQQQCCYASTSSSSFAAEAATSSSEPAVHYPTRHEKNIANLRYCQERAAWRRQVKELRKQWLAEIQQQKQAERQHAEAVRQEIARLQGLRSADKQHDREKHQLERLLWEAERAVECVSIACCCGCCLLFVAVIMPALRLPFWVGAHQELQCSGSYSLVKVFS
jgi:hypothetical protein